MDIPSLAAHRPYRPETIALLHDAFEAFWHKDFAKAWKLAALVSAAPLTVEMRLTGCAPQVAEALEAELEWAMDELTHITRGVVDLRDADHRPGDIEIEIAPLSWADDTDGATEYGRTLSPVPADIASLSIHGRISFSRRFVASRWRDQAELRRASLGLLAEVLGLEPSDVESMWCARSSSLPARQIQALCALQDVREFFESQPAVQAFMDLPVWPRPAYQAPSHAVVRTRTGVPSSPKHSNGEALLPKGVS